MLILTQRGSIINMDLAPCIRPNMDGQVVMDPLLNSRPEIWILGEYDTPERARSVVREIFNCRSMRYVMPEV